LKISKGQPECVYRRRTDEEHLPASYSDVRQLDFNSPFDITATTDGSCETTNLELQPVVVSEIPNDKEELEAYLRSITQKTNDRATCILISTRKRGSIPL
jgi:hypothetical protein